MSSTRRLSLELTKEEAKELKELATRLRWTSDMVGRDATASYKAERARACALGIKLHAAAEQIIDSFIDDASVFGDLEPTASKHKVDGGRFPVKRLQAHRVLKHYGINPDTLDLEAGAKGVHMSLPTGVRVVRTVTNAHPSKPLSDYALTANDSEAGSDWRDRLTNALKIARGMVNPTC